MASLVLLRVPFFYHKNIGLRPPTQNIICIFANMKYSFIVPVYNRPDEVDELLESLCTQTQGNFEVIIVEDGSSITCEDIVKKYASKLDIHYYNKPNSGPGQTRNYGVARANGEWVLILDSDVVLPPGYVEAVEKSIANYPCDAFGGPDSAHPSFSPTQKAINYAMTSFFTTGGIRGGKKKMDKFYPRSFNMGVRRDVYNTLNGFSEMRFGEDIDFSTRIFKGGYKCRLYPDAWVWHKRRTDLKKFFKQVHNSGIARIHLTKRHPGTLKLVHLLPAVFTCGVAFLLLTFLAGISLTVANQIAIQTNSVNGEAEGMLCVGTFIGSVLSIGALMPLILYSMLIFADSLHLNRSIKVATLSIKASFVQLIGYGSGFLRAWWKECVMGEGEFEAFKKNFYK